MTAPAADDAAPARGTASSARAEQWLRYDSRVRQGFITLALAVLGLEALRTVDDPAIEAWAYTLVAVNIVLMAVRILPNARRDALPEVALYVVNAVVAGVLLAFDRSGAAATFAFFLAGNIGFRRPYRQSLVLAALVAVLATAGIVGGGLAGLVDTPWYLGALTGTPVLVGISNRSRTLSLDSARAAAASAVQAAQAESRAHTMAERARIARDVHDVLAHSLAGVNLQLEVVDALLENGDTAAARAAAATAQRQVRESMAEVSRTVHTLREDALPLVDTLSGLVRAAGPPGTGFRVLGERREVPTPQATALARVAQESLTNARKHAPGAEVRVTLTFSPSATALDVLNGPATATSELTATGSGMGLVGIRERVDIVGGTVRTGPVVEGEHAGGWLVHVEVPA